MTEFPISQFAEVYPASKSRCIPIYRVLSNGLIFITRWPVFDINKILTIIGTYLTLATVLKLLFGNEDVLCPRWGEREDIRTAYRAQYPALIRD